MKMSTLQLALAAATPLHRRLSFAASLISATPQCVFFHSKLTTLSIRTTLKVCPIRMGGKTYPGGVSKAVWRRTQSRKRKKLKRDGISLERQIYERRKRAELKSAIAVLELPLESVDKVPKLFRNSDDEQLKVLPEPFRKPYGTDLRRSGNGLSSSKFRPKGMNQLDDSAKDLVQEFDSDDEEFGEDTYLSRKMENRIGKFDYLIKGLLSEDESDDELELKVLTDHFQKPEGTEVVRSIDVLDSNCFCPNRVNQSDDSAQEGGSDDQEECGEDIYLSRSGKFDILVMKELLFDDESDSEFDQDEDDTDVYEWNSRSSSSKIREKLRTMDPKNMNSEHSVTRFRSGNED